jgi:hypothetical protein
MQIALAAILGALTLGLMVAAGCGGGGPAKSNASSTGSVGGTVAPTSTGTGQAYATFASFLVGTGQTKATPVGHAKCAGPTCHTALVTSWSTTGHALHKGNSIECELCHGNGSLHVANPVSSNILHGANASNSAVCGQCHAQQYNDWAGSPHAQFVTDPVDTPIGAGAAEAPTCERCHSSEFNANNIWEPIAPGSAESSIVRSTDPLDYLYGRGYTAPQVNSGIVGLSTATFAQYAQASVGGGGITTATAACTNCHDPHANGIPATGENQTTLGPAGTVGQFYLRRAESNTDLSAFVLAGVANPNATTANYTTVNQICGNCHNNLGGNTGDANLETSFSRAPTHESPQYLMLNGYGGAEGTATPSIRTSSHVSIPSQCVQCHMGSTSSHTFEANTNNCAPCHSVSEAASNIANIQSQVQQSMGQLLVMLQDWAASPTNENGQAIVVPAAAASAVAAAKAAGDTSIWDYTANWSTATANEFGGTSSAATTAWEKSIPLAVLRARCNYYFLLVDRSYGVHNFKYTNWLLEQSIGQMTAILPASDKAPSLTKAQVQSILSSSLANAANASRMLAHDGGQ